MAPRRPTAFELSFGSGGAASSDVDSEAEVEHVMLQREAPEESNSNSLFARTRTPTRQESAARRPPPPSPRPVASSSGRPPFSSSSSGSSSRTAVSPTPSGSGSNFRPEKYVMSSPSFATPTRGRAGPSNLRNPITSPATPPAWPRATRETVLSAVAAGKRKEVRPKEDANANNRADKRRRVVETVEEERIFDLSNLSECLRESPRTAIVGEEEDDTSGPGADHDSKPIRLLTHFVIFDPLHRNALVSLDELLETNNKHFDAAGKVGPVYSNEEDAGQDYAADEDEDPRRAETLQDFRTTAIFTFSIDYSIEDGPVFLETQYAFYQLKKPSGQYSKMYGNFYRPHRIAQLAISMAMTDKTACTTEQFMNWYDGFFDEQLNAVITRASITEAYPTIIAAVNMPEYASARQAPFIQEILGDMNRPRSSTRVLRRVPRPFKVRTVGNIDLSVLRPENQTQTTVTPFVDYLAEGLFRERLHVLGPRLNSERMRPEMRARKLRRLLEMAASPPRAKQVEFARADRLQDVYWQAVKINHKNYEVGNVVLVPAGAYPGRERFAIPNPEELDKVPASHTLADYFWFAKIIYINQQTRTAHVQWFEHSSKTMLQEIHDPHELFMTKICNNVELELIVSQVQVQHICNRTKKEFRDSLLKGRKFLDFYYSFVYNQADGSFTEAKQSIVGPLIGPPPDNCPACAAKAEADNALCPQQIDKGRGVGFQGQSYHNNDFVMLDNSAGILGEDFGGNKDLCLIGQLVGIKWASSSREKGACTLDITPLGRVSQMLAHSAGENIFKDERYLFLTEEVVQVSALRLLGSCMVLDKASLPEAQFEEFLSSSPLHFYVTHICARLDIDSWRDREMLAASSHKLKVCALCFQDYQHRKQQVQAFKKAGPLRAFDPFAGVGAFALAMQEARAVKLTHAVEISPSAAKTLRKNSPDTLVYNQCANVILKEVVKADVLGHKPGVLQSITEGSYLPPLVGKGDIDCIIAGFPCQPHSTLNMYQRANDKKSHLILNLLSWIEHLQPRYCFFENVRGFLQYSLNAVQRDRYSVQGGIQAGGLKFFVQSLLTMGYQVRFALLDAAHYGTPQARVRFFLIAARLDCTIPSLPMPLYHIPVQDMLQIRLSHGLTISPIGESSGRVPFPYVSVEDAIGDLAWFDWRNPLAASPERPRTDTEQEVIPLVKVDNTLQTCGIKGGRYRHPPSTAFQKKAREMEAKVADLQHFTRPLKKETVARVTYIPLHKGADYHALLRLPDVPRDLWEWQYANPSSAIARKGFRSGLYGRLDKDKWFHTTVTNVEPTAKQSWVLNPWCKRVITVRELARSQGFPDHFQFYCVTDQVVKTMHREIGNAVPWPVGVALGRELFNAMFIDWHEKVSNAIEIDSE